MDILSDLEARGLIHDTTDRKALATRLSEGPITLYCGFDPTADSLHVGNLIGLLTLRRFQLAGHLPISLAGGATGMVGDPSGRDAERNLLDDEGLAKNLEGIIPQLRKFLDFEGESAAKLLDNRAWTVGVGILDFLRDIGKHVTVNQMIAKDSVKSRMSEGDGISYTEFSYMMLQGYDYLWLADNENCQLQVGGSDQWGNIVLGVDLIRRKLGQSAYALTWPLLTKPDGSKYGKTAGGETIWLSANRMSPYRFYQAWIGVDDSEVRKLLLQLTFLSVDDIDVLISEHEANPHLRLGQRTLASELTEIVHGETAAVSAAEASAVLFDSDAEILAASEAAFEFISGEVPSTDIKELGSGVIDLLVESGLCQSRKDAKRAINEGGIYINGERLTETDFVPSDSQLLHDRYLLLRRGKKLWHLLIVG
ncbi:MAG: hypothetical protein MB55_00925 [marine actinobacterium MedAcidi-G3]|nr:MAG: hypothetical protein MB55_00925 [marine actinobacterium MedAcidi-G3]MBA4812198.1 tyrosine--tRNA ligase [Acidimicrobiales bacterium]RPH18067.1 MAG: tyrosine--tRNA ligase [Actinobacteria bacterium TMED270]